MAHCSDSTVEFSVLSFPTNYLEKLSVFESVEMNNEPITYGIGSNTIIINSNVSLKLGLNSRPDSNISWAVLRFEFYSSTGINIFNKKRLIQIVINENMSDTNLIMSDDLLYNLTCDSYKTNKEWVCKSFSLRLKNEFLNEMSLPLLANKAVVSFVQTNTNYEDSFIDRLFQQYFAYPKYLCKGDVFSVHIDKAYMLDLAVNVHVDTLYFKMSDMQGLTSKDTNVDIPVGYLVDSSVTVCQVANSQDFLPVRKIPLFDKLDLNYFLTSVKFLDYFLPRRHNLVPSSFDKVFNRLCGWLEPLLYITPMTQGFNLKPIFLLLGSNGSGKSFILQAVSHYFGINYHRVDCVLVGGSVASQVEGKLKALFNQVKAISPCILHLSNIEFLFQDAEFKSDVRIVSCFEQQLAGLCGLQWPVVVVATSQGGRDHCVIQRLCLDTEHMPSLTSEQGRELLAWTLLTYGCDIDDQLLSSLQIAGFSFRDIQILAALGHRESYNRCGGENVKDRLLEETDFSRIISIMRKAYSDAIGAPKVPLVSWKDVGGLDDLKKEILRSIRSNTFQSGLKRSGLLLHGPPGTGKTLLAKAVASQCGRNFISVKGPELLNMYVGQSEQNVRDLFQLAKSASPCIVFFDELDSLAPNRGRSGDSGGVMDRVVSQLLAEMDGISCSDVFVLGATNRPDLIDPALLRPGRLDKQLCVGPCEDRGSQLSVLTALTHRLKLSPDVDCEQIVSQLPAQVTGAELSALCSAAWMSAARHLILSGEHTSNTVVILSQNNFLSAFQTVFKKS